MNSPAGNRVMVAALVLLVVLSIPLWLQSGRKVASAARSQQLQDEAVYLPLVRGDSAGAVPTATPTATPTLTPTPGPSPTPTATVPPPELTNGDFENGNDGSWAEVTAGGWPVIVAAAELPVAPHSGQWAAWLGGVSEEDAYIEQAVGITADEFILSYWIWIASEDTCGFDSGSVVINAADTAMVYDLCEEKNTEGWLAQSLDLSTYVGTTISLRFAAETDGSLNSNFFLDDVLLSGGN